MPPGIGADLAPRSTEQSDTGVRSSLPRRSQRAMSIPLRAMIEPGALSGVDVHDDPAAQSAQQDLSRKVRKIRHAGVAGYRL